MVPVGETPGCRNNIVRWLEASFCMLEACAPNYLRRAPPPKIPPSRPRVICRPSWLLAARIALLAIEVAKES
jgi:hypothetical protein